MTVLQTIPLAKLKPSKLNVRKTGGKSVEDLAASIRAIGLQQNLGVLETQKGFEVVFGYRRLRAMQALSKAGELPASLADGVPCNVLDEAAAHEASLAENTVREAMHPLDQFAAFAAMVEKEGKPIPDVAAAFGVSELVVKQRMRLSSVSPKLQKAYGAGEMTLEQLQAFAVSENQADQERVWKSLKSSRYGSVNPSAIRHELLSGGVTENDRRVLLVGLETYIERGGAVKRDLFSDTTEVLDILLLDSLIRERIQKTLDRVKAEGWAWVELRSDFSPWGSRVIEPIVDPVEDDFEKATAEEREILEAPEEDIDTIDEIEEKYRVWPDDAKARAGAVITDDGYVYRGVLPKDAPQEIDNRTEDHLNSADQEPSPAPATAALPGLVVQELTALRSIALRDSIRANPEAALETFVTHMAMEWHSGHSRSDGISIHFSRGYRKSGGEDADQQDWHKDIDQAKAFDQQDLRQLLAFLLGESVDLVVHAAYQSNRGEALCHKFGVDMRDHWRADDAFCMRLNGAMIRAALEECNTPETEITSILACKKPERSGRAAKLLADAQWLPACLRITSAQEAN